MNKHDRRLADSTVAAEESTHAMGNGYLAVAEAVSKFNMKLLRWLRAIQWQRSTLPSK